MQVTVNGVPADVDEGATLAVLISARTDAHRHIAVALNGDVVPRGAWEATRLTAGDSVEVLAPVAGG
ncbi:MAG: sulfur carrier protein ThiS [Geodermatophilaceae bacterium]